MDNRLAIVVPTYNRISTLKKLLRSIPETISVYISDNGDYLPTSLSSEFSNIKLKSVTPIISWTKNWNSAAQMASEEWLAIPSDDDFYYKNSFKIVGECIESNSDCDLIIFGHNLVDENDNVVGRWCPERSIYEAPNGLEIFQYGVDAKMISIFMKRSMYHKLGGFDESFKITASDSDFVQRALLKSKTLFVPEVISAYRVWAGSITHKTVASLEWMAEIELWTSKLDNLIKSDYPQFNSKKLKDVIYARNLCAGIKELKSKGEHINAVKHFMRCRYPYRADLISQLKLFVRLILP